MSPEPNANGPLPDWESLLRLHAGQKQDELLLTSIAPGDRVLIRTRNTNYLLEWQGSEAAIVLASSSKAPQGLVRVMGCSFGLSTSIRPDALFCGGNLEITHDDGERTWTTSAIREIHLLHRSETTS